MASLHIYAPQPSIVTVRDIECPTCTSMVPMLGTLYEWYGWHLTCLGCGERFVDGEMLERPFAPRWRQRSIQQALRWLPHVTPSQGGDRG